MDKRKTLKTILLSYLLMMTIVTIPYGFFADVLFFLLLASFHAIIGWKVVIFLLSFLTFEAYLRSLDHLLSLTSYATVLKGFEMQGLALVLTGLILWGWIMMKYLVCKFIVTKMNLWKRIGIKL